MNFIEQLKVDTEKHYLKLAVLMIKSKEQKNKINRPTGLFHCSLHHYYSLFNNIRNYF